MTEHKVGLHPGGPEGRGGGEKDGLEDHREVDEVAEVEHEEVVVDGPVGGVAQGHEEGQGDLLDGEGAEYGDIGGVVRDKDE